MSDIGGTRIALTKFQRRTNCSRSVRTNSARNALSIEELAELLHTTLDSAEAQAAKTLDEYSYEDFMMDLINLLNDCKTRLHRVRKERIVDWDDAE